MELCLLWNYFDNINSWENRGEFFSLKWFATKTCCVRTQQSKMLVKKKGFSNDIFWPWDQRETTQKRHNRNGYESRVRLNHWLLLHSTNICFSLISQSKWVFPTATDLPWWFGIGLLHLVLLRSSSTSSAPSTFRQPVSEQQNWRKTSKTV